MRRLLNKIKYRHQRCKYGISDYDLMDFDVWFLKSMPIILKRFKDKHHGIPCGYFENEFYELNKDKIGEDNYIKLKEGKMNIFCISDELGENFDDYLNKRWNEELDKMIYLFNECNNELPRNEYQEECKKSALEMFVKYFDGLWW